MSTESYRKAFKTIGIGIDYGEFAVASEVRIVREKSLRSRPENFPKFESHLASAGHEPMIDRRELFASDTAIEFYRETRNLENTGL